MEEQEPNSWEDEEEATEQEFRGVSYTALFFWSVLGLVVSSILFLG